MNNLEASAHTHCVDRTFTTKSTTFMENEDQQIPPSNSNPENEQQGSVAPPPFQLNSEAPNAELPPSPGQEQHLPHEAWHDDPPRRRKPLYSEDEDNEA